MSAGPSRLQSAFIVANFTWNLKMMVFKWNLLFQQLIFKFHVKLQGCMLFVSRVFFSTFQLSYWLIGGLGWWFGFLRSPYKRDCYLGVPRFESQTTKRPKPPTQTIIMAILRGPPQGHPPPRNKALIRPY